MSTFLVSIRRAICVLLGITVATVPAIVRAQAPSLQWFNNVGGVLSGLDNQTNIYVDSFGPIVKLNGSGVILQSNTICPIYARAQRDAAGNFYFADTFAPPRDFGGITLSNGYIFIAKYDSAGSLLWAHTVGPGFANSIGVTDFRVEPNGNSYVAYCYCLGSSCSTSSKNVDAFDPSGAPIAAYYLGGGLFTSLRSVRLGAPTETNVYTLVFENAPVPSTWGIAFSRAGAPSNQLFATFSQSQTGNQAHQAARPIKTALGELYVVEGDHLAKRSSNGDLIWTAALGNSISWTVCEDQFNGVHVADGNGYLRRFDSDGNQVWSLNIGSPVDEMMIDAQGNRFLSTTYRWVGRLGAEPVSGPAISTNPQGITVFSGSNVVLSVGATGSGPLKYFWRKDGVSVSNGTNATLNLSNATAAQSGVYTVVVSNFINSVTSSPAIVRIKAVQFFIGSQMLTNGTYNFINPPTISVLSAFTNGSIFYTLDGSTPTFSSTLYTSPFIVSSNATVRALGYSADFAQSEEADVISVFFPPKYSISTTTLGPGTVTLNPPGGLYQTGTVVTVTATPSAGWSFLYWTGDAGGTNPSIDLTADANKNVQAVFGTTLSTTATGGGQVQRSPAGGVYPYGTTVRLTPIPDAGKYFAVWGNAGSGNSNPLYFTVTNPNPTVSSLFSTLPEGQAALTVLINGPGAVTVDPAGNVFATNQTVTITATPLAGQGFDHWSGDASGAQNPVSVSMTQNRIITANFINWPILIATNRQGIASQGFSFSLISGTGMTYRIQSSSNLNTWTDLGVVTNTTGQTTVTDPSATNGSKGFYKAVPWP